MADIATSRASRTGKPEGADSTLLLIAAATVLALFLSIVVLQPAGVVHDSEYVPSLFGP
jgi:hypothetical protein